MGDGLHQCALWTVIVQRSEIIWELLLKTLQRAPSHPLLHPSHLLLPPPHPLLHPLHPFLHPLHLCFHPPLLTVMEALDLLSNTHTPWRDRRDSNPVRGSSSPPCSRAPPVCCEAPVSTIASTQTQLIPHCPRPMTSHTSPACAVPLPEDSSSEYS